MPHKFNTSRRHKFAKKKYRVTNWCGYNESLRNRGDLTVWITGDARKHWAAPRRRSRGGQPRYSDLAITMCLTLGMVYRLPLRQTQGLIRSISKLMLLEISVPDFSTLSRRGRGLSLPARPKIKITDPVHLAIDSTGLKVFDEGEWLQSKYNVKAKRKRWRKLHLGLNLVTGDIVCSDLTLDDVGDPTVLPDLLNQIGTPVSRFIADGAYDGAPTSDLLKARFGEAVEIIIPPPKNAIPSPQSKCFPSLPLKMLAPGNKKTRTARIWAYVRDERPWSGPCATGAQTDNLSSCAGRAPPCVWYQFTVDRKGEHPVKHLSGYQGWVHADGYAGFNGVFGEGKATEVACMAHIRRKFVDVFAAQGSAIAEEAIKRIAQLYGVEKQARGQSPEARAALRQENAKPIFDDLEEWLRDQLPKISGKSPLAKAIRYALGRMPKTRPYLDNGFLELDTDVVEQPLSQNASTHRKPRHWQPVPFLDVEVP